MSIRHISMGNAADMTTGLKREDIAKIPWVEIFKMSGVQRAMVLHDMERMGFMCQVRINLDKLREWKKSATSIHFHAGEAYGEYDFTTDWTTVPAPVALMLEIKRREEPLLGAGTMRGVMISDGYGGKIHAEESVPAASLDMYEIRTAQEGRLVIATS